MSVVDTLTGPVAEQVLHLPLGQVQPSPDNPRGAVGDVDGLAASIAANGLLQPIVVYPAGPDGMHEIVAGHRRYAAVAQLGLTTIPCLVRARPDDEAHTAAARIVENVQRADLTVADEARAYEGLAKLGWSQRDIATAVGVNQSHVSKRTALTLVPADLLDAIDRGDLTVEQGLAWVHVKRKGDPADADQLLELFRGADTFRFGRALETMVRQVRLAEARRKALDAAHKAAGDGEGPPVRDDVDMTAGHGYSALRAAGMVPASHLTEDYGRGARATRDQLVADGTLAVVVDQRADLLEVCTDPSRYLPPPDEPEPDHLAVDDRAALVEANSRRREWIVDHLAVDPAPPAAYQWLIRMLADVVLAEQTADVAKLAARAAGVDPSGSGTDVKRRMREAIDVEHPTTEQIGAACRIAQAITLLRTDRSLSNRSLSTWGVPTADDRAHLEAVAAMGWELTDAEREWLATEEDDAE